MWLEAVVVEPGEAGTGGKVARNEKGTPQGGVISPLLANLFPHWFDALFHGPQDPSRWADARLVRYADDMAILAREWTGELADWVESRPEGKFGLEINREKTRVVEVRPGGGSLDFLGYTFRWDRDLRGRPHKYLNVIPSAKAVEREREQLRAMTTSSQSHVPLPQLVDRLNRQLGGWANYFSLLQLWIPAWSMVGDRLVRTQPFDSASAAAHRPPKGVGWYEHIQSFGLKLLNKLPGKRPAHA
ncbi:MAG TPA: reverse transcriptase domain-containing protein [Bryobacteraceae bacterium]|nr:reverse transcriptase domain-containing protein [Bryobacteraceae bacterium]